MFYISWEYGDITEGNMKKINDKLKVIECECECSKCNKKYIFKSKFFDPYDFDCMCSECYKEVNKV